MKTNPEINSEQEKLSPEELKKRNEDAVKFYKEQIVLLAVRKEYLTILKECEEISLQRIHIQVKHAEYVLAANQMSKKEDTPVKEPGNDQNVSVPNNS